MTLIVTSCEKESEVAVTSSSILGDWEITSRVWEYIEDGKYVFTLASDGTSVVNYYGNVLSTSKWILSRNKIVFVEVTPEPGMSYDCEIKSLTSHGMNLVYYMEKGDDYADTMKLICKKR